MLIQILILLKLINSSLFVLIERLLLIAGSGVLVGIVFAIDAEKVIKRKEQCIDNCLHHRHMRYSKNTDTP
jgi:hypothetical protein